ncbi:MAG TPA: hypothetical protein VFU15_12720 [Bacteroidia bacterium]|nr:hypothetical protein [Bacteroidia bacterium]
MTRNQFLTINDQPCRIKLKSGKEVFGVIWEKAHPGGCAYYFSSLGERFSRASSVGMIIDLEDIVGAELLRDSGTLVG